MPTTIMMRRADRDLRNDGSSKRAGRLERPFVMASVRLIRSPRSATRTMRYARGCSRACLSEGLTEDAGGSQEQDQDQEDERDDVLPLGAEDGGAPVLDDAQDQTAEESATQVADTP